LRANSVSDLSEQINRHAEDLRRKGHRAQTLLPIKARNHSSFVIELLAAWQLGIPVWPVDPVLPEASFQKLAAKFRENSFPKGTALVLATSGSTGEPKSCVFTFERLARRFRVLQSFVKAEMTEKTLCLLPLHFGHGLICNTLSPLLNGSDVLLGPGFTPAIVSSLHEIVHTNSISFLSSTPVAWELIDQFGTSAKLPSLKRVHCASAPIHSEGVRKLQAWADSADCWNVYGLTEFGGWIGGGRLISGAARVDEFWGAEMKLENGEVFLRAPFAAEQVGDRWYATGDRGQIDDSGALVLLGRNDFLINKGGMKIQPEELELLTGALPSVQHCFCYGYVDEIWGQKIGLAIVLKNGHSLATTKILTHLRAHLSAYKIPDEIRIVENLVFTARGKLDRKASLAVMEDA
jgi:acyl-CoA synthetase (AMP-forming)/AMP-acid ligase II